ARHFVGHPASPLGGADGVHRGDLPAQLRDALVDTPAVGLQLGLTGATQTHTAVRAARATTGLSRQRLTPPTQAGKQVLELGELDLCLALAGTRVLGEDVEDQ